VLAFVMHLGARGVKGGFHRPGFEPPNIDNLPKAGRRRVPVPTP
jgi:flagellar biosynthetic protein FlhB